MSILRRPNYACPTAKRAGARFPWRRRPCASWLLSPETRTIPRWIAGKLPGSYLTDLQHPWRRIRARAELSVRIHDLRHSFASRALALGEGLPMIGKLLGHTQVQMIARYAHLARDTVKASAARIGDSIDNDLDAAERSALPPLHPSPRGVLGHPHRAKPTTTASTVAVLQLYGLGWHAPTVVSSNRLSSCSTVRACPVVSAHSSFAVDRSKSDILDRPEESKLSCCRLVHHVSSWYPRINGSCRP